MKCNVSSTRNGNIKIVLDTDSAYLLRDIFSGFSLSEMDMAYYRGDAEAENLTPTLDKELAEQLQSSLFDQINILAGFNYERH